MYILSTDVNLVSELMDRERKSFVLSPRFDPQDHRHIFESGFKACINQIRFTENVRKGSTVFTSEDAVLLEKLLRKLEACKQMSSFELLITANGFMVSDHITGVKARGESIQKMCNGLP